MKYYLDSLRHGKLSFFFLLIVIFFLPISREVFVIALWPWIFFVLLESFLYGWQRWTNITDFPLNTFLLIGLFSLLLISLLWTTNTSEGWRHIGRSALMIIIPVFVGFDRTLRLNNTKVSWLFRSYVAGACVSLLILLGSALIYSISIDHGRLEYNPRVSDWEHIFLYSNFSFLIHPTYYGMMVLMAASICLNEIKRDNLFSKTAFIPLILSTGFLLSLFLISSRTMIIAAAGVIAWFALNKIRYRFYRFIVASIILFALGFLFTLHPRFSNLREIAHTRNGTIYGRIIEQTDRGKTWHASIQLIKQQPILGLGVGDVSDSLRKIYREKNYFDSSKESLNCHNQFLESWLGVGVLGFVYLLFLFLFPFFTSGILDRFLYACFFLIVVTGFMFESLLNRLWGVAFVSFFYVLLTMRSGTKIAPRDHQALVDK